MSNTIGFVTAINQDTNIQVSILTRYATTLGKDRISLPVRIPPAREQQRYSHALARRAIASVNALYVRLRPQTASQQAVAKEALMPDPWLSMLVFRRMLEGIPTVEKLLAREQDWGLRIWIIVKNSTEDIRYQIYDKEWELMQRFPGLGVNFTLIDREDQPLEQLVTLQDIDLQFTFREFTYAI
jgi:hypothetical protein